jgi:hypothetical protein
MAEIVQLDDLVPQDITFVYRGDEYHVPGDLDTETVFKIFQHLKGLTGLRGDDGKAADDEAIRRASDNLRKILLDVFRIRQPDLETLPFGTRSQAIITERLLSLIGLPGVGEAEEPVPTGRAKPSPTRSSPGSRKPRSTRAR